MKDQQKALITVQRGALPASLWTREDVAAGIKRFRARGAIADRRKNGAYLSLSMPGGYVLEWSYIKHD